MVKLLLLCAFSCLFQSLQSTDVVNVYMTLTYETKMINPDGFLKNVSLVNGEFPGPTIR
jgi:hypothetical protein